MSAAVASEPQVWMFKAGPDSCEALPCTRAGVYIWTAPATAKRGDLFLLYCTGPVSAFVGIGRVCSETVAQRDRRLPWLRKQGRNRRLRYAAWVQILGLEQSVSLHRARADQRAGQWSALRNLAGTHARIRDAAVMEGFEQLLLIRNPVARDRWSKWQVRAPYPRDLDPRELDRFWWEPPEPGRLVKEHEVFLQRRVRNHLLRRGWRQHDEKRDGFPLAKSNLLRRSPDDKALFPDVVLVHVNIPKTLVIVEVKKHAVLLPGRSGIDQLDDYGPAMKRQAPDWTIKRWLVAETIDPAVRARAHTIDCFEWHGRPGGLKPVPDAAADA